MVTKLNARPLDCVISKDVEDLGIARCCILGGLLAERVDPEKRGFL